MDEVCILIQGHQLQMLDLITFGQKYEETLGLHGAGLKDELML